MLKLKKKKYTDTMMAPQIRVERVRVMKEGEEDSAGMLPCEGVTYDKPFKELYPGRHDERLKELKVQLEEAMQKAIGLDSDEDMYTIDPRNRFCDQRAPPPSRAFMEEYGVMAKILRGSPVEDKMGSSVFRRWSSGLYHALLKKAMDDERVKTTDEGSPKPRKGTPAPDYSDLKVPKQRKSAIKVRDDTMEVDAALPSGRKLRRVTNSIGDVSKATTIRAKPSVAFSEPGMSKTIRPKASAALSEPGKKRIVRVSTPAAFRDDDGGMGVKEPSPIIYRSAIINKRSTPEFKASIGKFD